MAGAGAAAFGGYDDLAGDGDRRGFRGHLGALAQGEVTTGAVKLGGIGAAGLVAAAVLGGGPADLAINAGLVAGGANLLNLFDLRPGRAIKVALASGALLAAAGQAAGRWDRHGEDRAERNGPAPAAGPGRAWPHRLARRSRCSARISVNGPCSGTPGPTRWARCSGWPPRPACPGPPGWRCWPASPG